MKLQPVIENRIPQTRLKPGDRIDGIVILGGHTSRVEAALDLLIKHPNTRAILSGPRYDEQQLVSEFQAARGRITIDKRARNTFENVVFSQELAKAAPGERWLLVTSALHMPRALGTFIAHGFCVAPWPVHDALPQPHITAPVILRELVGLFTYYMLGRTKSFFPGPSSEYQYECAPQRRQENVEEEIQ